MKVLVDEGYGGIHGVEGVLFDMDGTLVDCETHTETVARALLAREGVAWGDFDHRVLNGVSWIRVEEILRTAFPALGKVPMAAQLERHFQDLLEADDAPLVPGARAFFRASCAAFPTAIVTGSGRDAVAHLLARLDVQDLVRFGLSQEDYGRSKPDPECYLMAAERLGLAPAHCLVFEDSVTGLTAAGSAGMWTVAILHRAPYPEEARALAHLSIDDFTRLGRGFLEAIR